MAIKIPSLLPKSKPKDDFGEFSELDNWESDLNNFDFDDPTSMNSRTPKSMVREGLSEAFKSTFKNIGPAIFNKTREKFYKTNSVINEATRIKDELSYIKGEFRSDITPTLTALRESGKTVNSKIGSYLPKGISDTLTRITDDSGEEKYDKAPSKEDTQNQAISESLGKIFQEQAKHQDEKEKQDAKDKLVDRSVEKFRHEQTAELLNQIRIHTASDSLFRRSTFTAYLKKDLELKYKHLFVAKETLATLQASTKIFESKFNAVILNTSLPDIQKKKMTESIKSGLEMAMGSRFSSFGREAISKFMERLRSTAKEGASLTNTVSDMLGMLGSFAGMTDFISPGQLIGDFAGQGLAGLIGGKIANKLFGIDGKFKKERDIVELYSSNLEGKLSSHLKRLQSLGSSSPLGFLLNFVAPNTKSLVNKARSPEDPVPFDLAAKTSLVSIIPGYLARILQQVTNISTGTNNELLRYDYNSHTFLKESEWHRAVGTRLAGNRQERSESLGNYLGSLRGNYISLHSNEEVNKFDSVLEDIKTVILNSRKLGGLDFDDLTRYVYSEGNPYGEYQWSTTYIRELLKGIGQSEDFTDPQKLKVAEQLVLTVNRSNVTKKDKNGEDVTYRFERDNIAQELALREQYSYFDTEIDPRRELNRLQVTGQLEGIGNILEYNRGTFKIKDDKWRQLEGNVDPNIIKQYMDYGTSSIANAYNYLKSGKEFDPKLEELLSKASTGDLQALKDLKDIFVDKSTETIQTYVDELNKFKKDPKLLLKAIKISDEIKEETGEEDSKSFLETIKNFDFNKYNQLPKHLKTKVSDFWNKAISESDTVKEKQKEQEKHDEAIRQSFNDEYINQVLTNKTEEITTNINKILERSFTEQQEQPQIKVLQDQTSTFKNTLESRTQSIVDAIVHFENVFTDYAKYRDTTQVQEIIKEKTKTQIPVSTPLEDSTKEDTTEVLEQSEKKSRSIIEPQEPVTTSKAKSFSEFTKKKEKVRTELNNLKNTIVTRFKEFKWVEALRDDKVIQEVKEAVLTGEVKSDNPVVKELADKFAKYKDHPEELDDVLFELQVLAQDRYTKIKNYISTKYEEAQTRVNTYLDEHKEEIDSVKTTIKDTKEHAFNFLEKQYTDLKNYVNKENRFIDVYPKEYLEDKDVSPLVTAEQFRDQVLEFKNGDKVPDAYSIDKPVFLRLSSNQRTQVISSRNIKEGIYDEHRKDITKRSLSKKISRVTKTVVSKGLSGAFDLAKFGIEGGLRAALFGMGIYGQIYWQMLKFGWALSKGVLGGIFNFDVLKSGFGLLGSGIKNAGKLAATAGIGLASPVLWAGSKLINGIFGTNLSGPMGMISKLWGFDKIGSSVKGGFNKAKDYLFGNKEKGDKGIFGKTKDSAMDFASTVSGLVPSSIGAVLGKKKTPEERQADAAEATAKNTKELVKIEKKKDSWWNRIGKKLSGIAGFFGFDGNSTDTNSTTDALSDMAGEAAGEVIGDKISEKISGDKDNKDSKKKDKKDTKKDKNKSKGKDKPKGKPKPKPKKPGSGVSKASRDAGKKVVETLAKNAPKAATTVASGASKLGWLGRLLSFGAAATPTLSGLLTPFFHLLTVARGIDWYEEWANQEGNENFITSDKIEEAINNTEYANTFDGDLEDLAYQAAMNQSEKRATQIQDQKTSELSRLSIESGKQANQLGTITCPAESKLVTSPFGYRNIEKGSKYHEGIDLRAREGDPIFAMADGKVSSTKKSFGEVLIVHKNKIVTKYVHNSKILVKQGDVVKSGDIIAYAGGVGRSGCREYDPHLHFAILKDGSYLDPERYLMAAGIKLTRKADLPKMAPLSDFGVTTDVKKSSTSGTSSTNATTGTTGAPTNTSAALASTYGDTAKLGNPTVDKITPADLSQITADTTNSYTPNSKELGSLSSRFESGAKGSASVNPDDNGNGASYGKYQINEGTGTFDEFLNYASKQGKIGQEVSRRLKSVSGKKRHEEWIKLANENKIQQLEKDFIEKFKYNRALDAIQDPELRKLIDSSDTLKDVIWSTAVQHGEKGASDILNAIWKSGMSATDLARAIYTSRANKSPTTRDRFNKELSLVLAGLQKEGLDVIKPLSTETTAIADNSVKSPIQPVTHTADASQQITVRNAPLVEPVSTTSKQVEVQKTQKVTEVADNSNSVLDSILREMKTHTDMLTTINNSIGGVNKSVDKTTEEFGKIILAFGKSGIFSNTQNKIQQVASTPIRHKEQISSLKLAANVNKLA